MRIFASRTGVQRRARTLAAALAVASGMGIAGVATASPAAAADPVTLYYAGQNVNFPTWLFGRTTVCATNLSSWSYGYAAVRPLTAPAPTYLSIAPGSTRCTSGYWGGVPVNVANVGTTTIRAYSY